MTARLAQSGFYSREMIDFRFIESDREYHTQLFHPTTVIFAVSNKDVKQNKYVIIYINKKESKIQLFVTAWQLHKNIFINL